MGSKLLGSVLKEKIPAKSHYRHLPVDDQNVLWVGMLLSTPAPKTDTKKRFAHIIPASTASEVEPTAGSRRSKRKNSKTNWEAKPEEGRHIVPTDPEAIRAIVKYTSKHNKVYSLINSQEGSCEGFIALLNDTFFFSQFRNDGILAITKQTSVWSGLIHQHLHGAQSRQEGSNLSTRFDRLVIRVPWQMSKGHMMRALVAQSIRHGILGSLMKHVGPRSASIRTIWVLRWQTIALF